MTYHVGLLVIDEIQNVVSTAQRTNQVKPLIRFLTELTNDTCTSIYFVGTTLAETVFRSEEYLRRRTRGPRLLPFKPDHAYRDFLSKVWPYQVTVGEAELTDKLANVLYDYSGGIPAYITRIFEEAQATALVQNAIRIDDKLIRQAAEYLAIEPPKELGTGTFISDISVSRESVSKKKDDVQPIIDSDNKEEEPVERQFANKRGRKIKKRDETDLIEAYKNGTLIEILKQHHMYEELVIIIGSAPFFLSLRRHALGLGLGKRSLKVKPLSSLIRSEGQPAWHVIKIAPLAPTPMERELCLSSCAGHRADH